MSKGEKESQSSSIIEFKENSFTHTLTCKNFNVSSKYCSEDKIEFDGLGHDWYMILDLTKTKYKIPFVYVKMIKMREGIEKVKGRYSINLLCQNGTKLGGFQSEIWQEFKKLDILGANLNNIFEMKGDINILKIQFTFWELDKVFHKHIGRKRKLQCELEYAKDFRTKLMDDFTDFTIIAGDVDLKVNKCILAARSDVFFNMLKSGLKETQENELRIEDFSGKIVTLMIDFFYKETIEVWPKQIDGIFELLKISDKYQIGGLKSLCEDKLIEILNLENCIDILSLAESANSPDLKLDILDFIKINLSELKKITQFKTKAAEFPELLVDLLLFDV